MFYILKDLEIICTVETEQEAIDYINNSADEDIGGMEYYPEEARIRYE